MPSKNVDWLSSFSVGTLIFYTMLVLDLRKHQYDNHATNIFLKLKTTTGILHTSVKTSVCLFKC